jgi:hypothetical protein
MSEQINIETYITPERYARYCYRIKKEGYGMLEPVSYEQWAASHRRIHDWVTARRKQGIL